MEKTCTVEPWGDVHCEDGVRHTLWRCSQEDMLYFQETFASIPAVYVADGHHRTAAAYNVGKLRKEAALEKGIAVTGEEEFNFFMSIMYPADSLLVMDYNRVLKTLNGMSDEAFLEKLSENF